MTGNFDTISGLVLTTREIGLIITSASQALVQGPVIIETETEIIACWIKEGESSKLYLKYFNVC
jgi:hypothetical protein